MKCFTSIAWVACFIVYSTAQGIVNQKGGWGVPGGGPGVGLPPGYGRPNGKGGPPDFVQPGGPGSIGRFGTITHSAVCFCGSDPRPTITRWPSGGSGGPGNPNGPNYPSGFGGSQPNPDINRWPPGGFGRPGNPKGHNGPQGFGGSQPKPDINRWPVVIGGPGNSNRSSGPPRFGGHTDQKGPVTTISFGDTGSFDGTGTQGFGGPPSSHGHRRMSLMMMIPLYPECKNFTTGVKDKSKEMWRNQEIGPGQCQGDSSECFKNDMERVRCRVAVTPSAECMAKITQYMQGSNCPEGEGNGGGNGGSGGGGGGSGGGPADTDP